jgi:hypothetical protein
VFSIEASRNLKSTFRDIEDVKKFKNSVLEDRGADTPTFLRVDSLFWGGGEGAAVGFFKG